MAEVYWRAANPAVGKASYLGFCPWCDRLVLVQENDAITPTEKIRVRNRWKSRTLRAHPELVFGGLLCCTSQPLAVTRVIT
jgi:hypothetical protein